MPDVNHNWVECYTVYLYIYLKWPIYVIQFIYIIAYLSGCPKSQLSICVLSKPFTFNTDSYKNIKKNLIFHYLTPCIIF